MTLNSLYDLVKTTLESTHSAHSNVLLGSTTSVFISVVRVLAQGVAVANSIHVFARVAMLVLVLVKPKGKSTLVILLLHFFNCKGNSKERSEKATDMMGGIAVVNMAHEGGA